jgi:hypothetical protein
VATDLAAAKHEDLSTAATQLGKIYNGNTKLLKQFGIVLGSASVATHAADTATRQAATADARLADAKRRLVDLETIDAAKKKLTVTQAVRLQDAEQKVTTATQNAVKAHQNLNGAQQTATAATKAQAGAIDQLGQKLQGQAAASADTFTGKLKAITTTIEDQAAAFGNKYGPALQVAGQGVAVLGAAWTGAKALHEKFKASTEDGVKKAGLLSKAMKGLGQAVSAVAAVFVAAEIGVTAAVLIIVGVILALVVVGYIVYRNWSTIWPAIKATVKAVFDWIKNNWPLLVGILVGPVGIAAALIYKYWDAIVGFFEKLPGRIASIASGMWNGIANAFVDVINFIIHIWNGLQFKIPGVGFGPFHTPSFTLGMPNIPNVPHLAAGGLITRDGLIYAHAGEAVTPARGMGPAVQFTGPVNLNNGVDVELLSAKLAWMVQTARI